ncbi:protein AF-9-like [Limulus polyphemus]|uniref:Protein AF-9-like n=1 Tax=Limulus polyphemus TaxID=6850 RepID=A0ABM1BXY2_LIMPO|nr:protein AF-9-like [Limulus polyphemus]
MQCVEVKLELGHRATQKTKPTPEGFTHDWCVFVRGPDKLSIQHFVEKVVFHLHESFPKPKRVIKEPPYQVSESGYAGFMFPIEVYFRNKEEPKKVVFQYDLYLRLEGPVSNTRAEKLTFQNPTEEFRKKLLKAGGVAVTLNPAGGTIPTIQPQPPPSQHIKGVSGSEAQDHHPQVSSKQPATKTTPSSEVTKEKKPKPSPIKDGGKLGSSSHPVNQPFTDIFGPVLKTQSPNPGGKQKEGPSAKPGSGTPKSSKSSQGGSSSSSSKETKPPSLSKDKSKHHKESKQHKETKEMKSHNKEGKEISKRPQSPTQGLNSSVMVCKKRKRTTSTSSVASSVMSVESSSKDKQYKDKKEKKENHQKLQNKSNISENAVKKEKEQEKPSKQVTQASSNSSLKTKYDLKKKKERKEEKKDVNIGESNVKSSSTTKPKKIKEQEKLSPVPIPTATESFEQLPDDGNSSPASSISLSSLATGGTHGPLAAMMAEMEKDNELLSPLSSCPDSPVETSLPKSKETLDLSDEEIDTKINHEEKIDTAKASKVKKEKKDSPAPKHEKNHVILSEEASEQVSETKSQKSSHHSQFDPSYLAELEKLRQQIMSLRDRGHIQRVVDVIEQTGLYFVTDSTFDFDLCCLDKNTIRKLQNCLTVK